MKKPMTSCRISEDEIYIGDRYLAGGGFAHALSHEAVRTGLI
jgi:hypothetical protein